jgi:hypothetical protein
MTTKEITADRAADFYTAFQFGPKQSETPEGFLLCESVPIARTGAMIYSPDQVPILPDPAHGMILIERDAPDVFHENVLKSLLGKPVVNEHPAGGVFPDNARIVAVGVMVNGRQGNGDQEDLLLADLLIWDRDTIQSIRDGKREVSLGYDAQYIELAPGKGRQKDIIVNHVALVERGRCGPRCSIGDAAPNRGSEMAKPAQKFSFASFTSKILNAVHTKDEAGATEALKELEASKDAEPDDPAKEPAKDAGTDPASQLSARMDSIEAMCKGMGDNIAKLLENKTAGDKKVGDETEEEKAEKAKAAKDAESEKEKEKEQTDAAFEREGVAKDKRSTKDSDCLGDVFQSVASVAEIIMPGISVPTFDRALPAKKTLDTICGIRRKTLETAFANEQKRKLISDALGGRELNLTTMTCDAVAVLFSAVGNASKHNPGIGGFDTAIGAVTGIGGMRTPLDIEKQNRAYYDKKTA